MKLALSILVLLTATSCQFSRPCFQNHLASFNDRDRVLELAMQVVLTECPETTRSQWEFEVAEYTVGSDYHFAWQERPDFPAESIEIQYRRFLKNHTNQSGDRFLQWQVCVVILTQDGKTHKAFPYKVLIPEIHETEGVEQPDGAVTQEPAQSAAP